MVDKTNKSLSAELLEIQRTLGWMDIVLGSITDAVYVTDNDAKIIFANQYFSNLVGIARVFLLGQKLDEVFKTELMEKPQKEFLVNRIVSSDEDSSYAKIHKLIKNDQQYIFKISFQLIPTTCQTVYVAKDITSEYEFSVIQSDFINIASHQLRTPMTAIMTYAHMLHNGYGGILDDKQKKFTKTIIGSSERMIGLINNILLIARIQNGETNLLAKDDSLVDILSKVEFELKSSIDNKKLTLRNKYDQAALKIKCNSFVIHEIVSNIVTNSIQYTPNNGLISISAKIKNKQIEISISDTGIGIADKDLPNIFEQFSRAKNAMEAFNEGTGLGLYLVKILVTQIKGTIECQSKLNRGTKFKIAFPL